MRILYYLYLPLLFLCFPAQAGETDLYTRAENLMDNGQYEEARQCLIQYINENPDNTVGIAAATTNLGEIMVSFNQKETAERYYLRSYELYTQLAKEEPSEYIYFVARCQHNLGCLYYQMRRLKPAKKLLLLALRRREKLFALNRTEFYGELGQTLSALASFSSLLNKYPEAEKYYLQAIEHFETIETPSIDARIGCASTYNNLALVCKQMEKTDEAELYFQKAIQMYESLLDEIPSLDKQGYYSSLNNLAKFYLQQKKTKEAEMIREKIK